MSVALCERCLGTGKQLNPVELGKVFKSRRVKAGVTQAEIAKRMNIDKSQLCMMEGGKRAWNTLSAIRFEIAMRELGIP